MTTAVLPETVLPVLTMDGGLAGFPGADRYALVELPEASPLFLLRSLDVEGLEFVVAPPAVFFADYAPELDDATVDLLGITDATDVLLLVMLTVGTGIETATANLLAPIVINQRTRSAAQVVLQADWPLRAPLRP
ncbi:MAG: flagellar assembly protein FliW [Mycobacteriales bacterium]